MAKKKSHGKSVIGKDVVLSCPTPASDTSHKVVDLGKEITNSSMGSRSLGVSDTWSESLAQEGCSQSIACDRSETDNLPDSGAPPPNESSTSERIKLKFVEYDDVCYKVKPSGFDDISQSLGFVLIGYTAGKFPGKKAIDDKCRSWGVKYLLHFHDSGWIILKFFSEDDRARVLDGGPYFVFDRPLMLEPMPPFFNFEKREQHMVPVWIKLPGLPYGCWNAETLSGIASRFGTPLHSDRATALKEKLDYARVLVVIDVTKYFRRSIPVCLPDGTVIEQKVWYEYIPKQCSMCKVMGHASAKCPLANSSTVDPKTKAKESDGIKCGNEGNGEAAQTALGNTHIRFSEDEQGSPVSCPSTGNGIDKANLSEKSEKYIAPPKIGGIEAPLEAIAGSSSKEVVEACGIPENAENIPAVASTSPLQGPEDGWPPLSSARAGCTQTAAPTKEKASVVNRRATGGSTVDAEVKEKAKCSSSRPNSQDKYDNHGMLIRPQRRNIRGRGGGRGNT